MKKSTTAPLFLRIKNRPLKEKLLRLAKENRRSTQAQAEVLLEEAIELSVRRSTAGGESQ